MADRSKYRMVLMVEVYSTCSKLGEWVMVLQCVFYFLIFLKFSIWKKMERMY